MQTTESTPTVCCPNGLRLNAAFALAGLLCAGSLSACGDDATMMAAANATVADASSMTTADASPSAASSSEPDAGSSAGPAAPAIGTDAAAPSLQPVVPDQHSLKDAALPEPEEPEDAGQPTSEPVDAGTRAERDPDGRDASEAACAGPAAGGPCDPITQCGCPTGLSCRYELDDGRQLVSRCELPGPKPEGAICRSPSECAAGLTCDAGGPEQFGMCLSACDTRAAAGVGCEGYCARIGSGDSGHFGLCHPGCDPERASDCQEGAFCAPSGSPSFKGLCEPGYREGQCPTEVVSDGTCDGPSGTGRCASDREDPQDCTCLQSHGLDGGPCDPLTQCGCQAGLHCLARAGEQGGLETVCRRPGEIPTGTPCAGGCEAGAICYHPTRDHEGVCARWCDPRYPASCDGRCEYVADWLGVCLPRCDAEARTGCLGDIPCVETPSGGICRPPYRRGNCPVELQGNAACDGPSGSGRCAEDADDPDCADGDEAN